MLSLKFFLDKYQAVELEEEADAVLRDLTRLDSLKEQFEYVPRDVKIMFHKAHDHHHDAHVTFEEFQIQDLLYVSPDYLRRLPEIYDAHLLKIILDCYLNRGGYFNSQTSFTQKLEQNKDTIEKFLFLINASEILSEHVKKGKKEYCPEIADKITQKNLQSMGRITLKKKSNSGLQGSENVFHKLTNRILQRPQKPKWTEEPLFDQECLSLILGRHSPYRGGILYCRQYQDFDNTAERLSDATTKPGTLRIPKILDSNYASRPIITPDFSEPDPDDYPLRRQLDLFLPARAKLETEFWERYEGAHCVFSCEPER